MLCVCVHMLTHVLCMYDAGLCDVTRTDVMCFADGTEGDGSCDGMVKRIVTVNHKTGVCYSPASSV